MNNIINIIYYEKSLKEDEIKIFGDKFVLKNKNRCK